VLSLFDEVYESAIQLSVQKDISVEMQDMMRNHYQEYRNLIETVYNNRGEE